MIDSEDRALAENLEHLLVELSSRLQIAAKGLFDHDAMGLSPTRHHPRAPEMLDDGNEEVRRGGAIEEAVSVGPEVAVDALQFLLESKERGLVVEVAAHVTEALGKALPDGVHGLAGAGVLVDRCPHLLAELFVGQRPSCHTYNGEVAWVAGLGGQVVEGRRQL